MRAEAFYTVHRRYQPGTRTYSSPDPLGEVRPDREAFFSPNNLYTYAASAPTFFVDLLGQKVVIDNPKTQESYDQLKECFPLFRNVAEHFEEDTWTEFGPARTWTIKDPDWTPGSCAVGSRRSEPRTIWVPPERDCEGTMRCLMHDFYELWLIRAGGYPKSRMGAGPADDMARRFEEHIPFDRCCPCD